MTHVVFINDIITFYCHYAATLLHNYKEINITKIFHTNHL